MEDRRALTVIVGIVQSIIAVLIVIFACLLYFNFFDVQTWLNAAARFSYVYLLTLLVFGFFSIISGLLLVQEWLESR
ncbi:MAG: hypothetical protein OEW62_02280 [Candidatus Bathyarchaeota archaeon]|nr:hypothetical protein [Candidatus Bathyarchaeota archaeon]